MDERLPSSLEKRNMENLIRFYEEGLRLVAGGASATEVFPEYERGKLRNAGILRYMNLQWVISDEAKKYLRARTI